MYVKNFHKKACLVELCTSLSESNDLDQPNLLIDDLLKIKVVSGVLFFAVQKHVFVVLKLKSLTYSSCRIKISSKINVNGALQNR